MSWATSDSTPVPLKEKSRFAAPVAPRRQAELSSILVRFSEIIFCKYSTCEPSGWYKTTFVKQPLKASQHHDGLHWDASREGSIWEELPHKKSLSSTSSLPNRRSSDYSFLPRDAGRVPKCLGEGWEPKPWGLLHAFLPYAGLTWELLRETTQPQST